MFNISIFRDTQDSLWHQFFTMVLYLEEVVVMEVCIKFIISTDRLVYCNY